MDKLLNKSYSMIELILIGKVENEFYGVSCNYEYGDIFLMNRFLRYIIQNFSEISNKLIEKYDEESISKFHKNISQLNEYEIVMFLNLEYSDLNIIENRFILDIHKYGVYLENSNYKLNCKFPIIFDLLVDEKIIDVDKIEEYINKQVKIYITNEETLIFMSKDQFKNNLKYLTEVIDKCLSPFSLSSKSNKNDILDVFNIEYE